MPTTCSTTCRRIGRRRSSYRRRSGHRRKCPNSFTKPATRRRGGTTYEVENTPEHKEIVQWLNHQKQKKSSFKDLLKSLNLEMFKKMTHVTYAVLREDVMRQTSFTPETVRLLFLCGQVDVAKLFEMKPGTKEAVAFGEVEGREGEMGVGEVKGVVWDGVMGGVGKKRRGGRRARGGGGHRRRRRIVYRWRYGVCWRRR